MTIGDAREVLVAELLGDAGRMLDRIDAVMPQLENAAARIEHASAAMPEATAKALSYLSGVISQVGVDTENHAIAVTNSNADKVFVAQTAQLRATAKVIFDKEVTPPLRELTGQLHAAIHQSKEDPWNRWLTHAATAMVAMWLPIVLPFLISLASPSSAKASSTALVPECAQPASAPADAAQSAASSSPQSSKARARR